MSLRIKVRINMLQILECVPNVSEGRDISIITGIEDSIRNIKDVTLLHTDTGKAANRTVFTFAGSPEAVVEAAFQMSRTAARLIDMRHHSGEHPRIGAVDVLPLVPVKGIMMNEAVSYSRRLALRIGEELAIPVYCYEYSAFSEKRKKLEDCRAGEYEGLATKMTLPDWKPDYGPGTFNSKSGATIVGARNLLVAYNINLNTSSVQIAKSIASEVRESGKVITESGGIRKRIPGSLKSVKAIGWFIAEYGCAQVSMNLTDMSVTPVHKAFDEVSKAAGKYNVEVTGSEVIGLISLQAMLDAGKYYSREKNETDQYYIMEAISSLGLNQLYKFLPEEKIIEYKLKL